MRKNVFYAIPLILIALALQLTFFWLVPNVESKWIVYCIGTIMTSLHLFLVYYLGTRFGTRRSAATVVAGTVIQSVLLIASAVLVMIDATSRNTVFMLSIISIFYIAIVTSLGLFIESVPESNDIRNNISVNDRDEEEVSSCRDREEQRNNRDYCHSERRSNENRNTIYTNGRSRVEETGRRPNLNPPPLPNRR